MPSQSCTSCCRICLSTAAVYENTGVGVEKCSPWTHATWLWEKKCYQIHKENRFENKANIFSHLFKFYHSAVLFLVVVDITFCRKKLDRSIQLAVLSFPVLIAHLANSPILCWELCSVTFKTTGCPHDAFPFFGARDRTCPTRPGIQTTQHVLSCLVVHVLRAKQLQPLYCHRFSGKSCWASKNPQQTNQTKPNEDTLPSKCPTSLPVLLLLAPS